MTRAPAPDTLDEADDRPADPQDPSPTWDALDDALTRDFDDADTQLGPTGNEPPPLDDVPGRAALSAERIDAVRRLVRARKAGGALLTARRNFSWLTAGGSAHVLQSSEEAVASVLVSADGARILTSRIEAERIATEEVAGIGLEIEAYDWFDEGGATHVAEDSIRGRLLADRELESNLQPLRSVLSPLEHDRMAWLGDQVREALEQALENVEQDEPEDFLAADASMILGDAGIRAPVVLVAGDDRIERFRHPLPGRGCIQQRVMLVLVGERWGLHVAATAIRDLEPPPSELVRRSRGVDRVLAAMVDATRPGATLGAVFAAAQKAYKAAGFPDEWRLHHQGGTIGYASRERVAVPGDPTPISAGMAFAWNPSITGAKAETTFILGDGGEARFVV